MEEPMTLERLGRLALIVVFGSLLAACGSTWAGLKEDTGRNMQTVGDSVSSAGEHVEESGEEEQKTQ
jgi:hypothetical protein